MTPPQWARSAPLHVRKFLDETELKFPLDWHLDQVAEDGFQRHHQRNAEARARWQRESRPALVHWALAKLAVSSSLTAKHWNYLEPESPRGPLDSIQARLRGVLEVADGRLPTWRGKVAPGKALLAMRKAIATLRRYELQVTFNEVADHFSEYQGLRDSIDRINDATMRPADQAAREAAAIGEEPLVALAYALRHAHIKPTPTLDQYLIVLDSKLDWLEQELVTGPHPALLQTIGEGPLGLAKKFGKQPRKQRSLERAVVLGLAWDFLDGLRRPRLAMPDVIQLLCDAWFKAPYSVKHIEALISAVRRDKKQAAALFNPAPRKTRKSKPIAS